jgi:hypothetical protein
MNGWEKLAFRIEYFKTPYANYFLIGSFFLYSSFRKGIGFSIKKYVTIGY